jgi:hypothetical protein
MFAIRFPVFPGTFPHSFPNSFPDSFPGFLRQVCFSFRSRPAGTELDSCSKNPHTKPGSGIIALRIKEFITGNRHNFVPACGPAPWEKGAWTDPEGNRNKSGAESGRLSLGDSKTS